MFEHTKDNQLLIIISDDGLDTSTGISKLYLIQSSHLFFLIFIISL